MARHRQGEGRDPQREEPSAPRAAAPTDGPRAPIQVVAVRLVLPT
jgi:hypothetical protein